MRHFWKTCFSQLLQRENLLTFFGFLLFLLVLRILATNTPEWGYHKKVMIIAALLFTVSYHYLWQRSRSWLIGSAGYGALFLLSVLVQRLAGERLLGREVADAWVTGMAFYFGGTFLHRLPCTGTLHRGKAFLHFLGRFLLLLGLLLPLLLLGYCGVSGGHLLSADIVLTLFQTNLNESVSYLKNQNLVVWGLAAVILAGVLVFLLRQAERLPEMHLPAKGWQCMLLGVLFLSGCFRLLPQSVYPAFRISRETREVLQDYRRYGRAKQLREQRLAELPPLKMMRGGVYVLVIGESESRDHMQVYGYDRPTTPWLQSMKGKPELLLFSNAYSNHTHTVPVLTYALSQKNQYNNVSLADAYSLVEAARAAGFHTYWISNQRKLGGYDTPIAEIASTAEYQVWKNNRSGTADLQAPFYDEVLVDALPDIQPEENALIVIHVMGCHGDYRDRYPREFDQFTGRRRSVNTYDNAVLYSDWVLEHLYERVSHMPGFQAMVFFSDHGDDPDRNVGHEASKFTWTMVHIPLGILVSRDFREHQADMYRTLQQHEDRFWTNDLLYNLMLDVMTIQGMPGEEPGLDLASPQYKGERETLRTLHGKEKLSEE